MRSPSERLQVHLLAGLTGHSGSTGTRTGAVGSTRAVVKLARSSPQSDRPNVSSTARLHGKPGFHASMLTLAMHTVQHSPSLAAAGHCPACAHLRRWTGPRALAAAPLKVGWFGEGGGRGPHISPSHGSTAAPGQRLGPALLLFATLCAGSWLKPRALTPHCRHDRTREPHRRARSPTPLPSHGPPLLLQATAPPAHI